MFSKDNQEINHIIDNLYLGDCSHSEDELLKLNISYVFNMTPNDYRNYDKMIEIKFPIQDIISQNIIDIYPSIIKKIKELNDEGLKIYIHCHAGISRSASLVILYVMKYHQMTFDVAFKFVRDKRLCIQPNPSFIEQLKLLEKIEIL
jgi:protein-tyrosine phosphatase